MWQFWVDRGGTFTDIVARKPDGTLQSHKLLSENPERFKDAAVQGSRELLNLHGDTRIRAETIEAVKMGQPWLPTPFSNETVTRQSC